MQTVVDFILLMISVIILSYITTFTVSLIVNTLAKLLEIKRPVRRHPNERKNIGYRPDRQLLNRLLDTKMERERKDVSEGKGTYGDLDDNQKSFVINILNLVADRIRKRI